MFKRFATLLDRCASETVGSRELVLGSIGGIGGLVRHD